MERFGLGSVWIGTKNQIKGEGVSTLRCLKKSTTTGANVRETIPTVVLPLGHLLDT